MATLRLLFADDQIPDEQLSEDEVKVVLEREYRGEGFRNAFLIMRKAVETLRGSGYHVTIARFYEDAMSLVKKENFDMAIIDLGWFADKSLPSEERPYAGWKISQALDEADKSKSRLTPQIIYSNRFEKDPAISIQAAEKRKLPLFKIYAEAGHQALRAAVKFIESHVNAPSEEEQFLCDAREILLQSISEPLQQHKSWFRLTAIFVSLSLALLLAGIATAIWSEVQVSILTSVSSVITGAVSSLLYTQLKRTRKTIQDGQEKLQGFIEDAAKRLKS